MPTRRYICALRFHISVRCFQSFPTSPRWIFRPFAFFFFLRCRVDQLHQDWGPEQSECVAAPLRLLISWTYPGGFLFLKRPPFCRCCHRAADGAPPAEGRHAAAGRCRLHAAASRRGGRQQRDPQVPHRQWWETHPDTRSLHFDSEHVVQNFTIL